MKDDMGTLTSEEAEFLKVYLEQKVKQSAGDVSVSDVAEKASAQQAPRKDLQTPVQESAQQSAQEETQEAASQTIPRK